MPRLDLADKRFHPKYRADIDGLRAIAALSVVIYHAFPSVLSGGFTGVDIFFVISGFLITSIITGGLDNHQFSFVEFYSRRIRRIFPALILILLACYAFGWFALLASEYKQLGKHIASGAGFISNFVLWNEAGYFDNAADTKPLLHLWTLGIEEQYYICWPLLLWFAWKRRLGLLGITLLIGLTSFLFNIVNVNLDEVETFYSPLTRFWELMLGSALGLPAQHLKTFLGRLEPSFAEWSAKLRHARMAGFTTTLCNALSILGALLILAGLTLFSRKFVFPGLFALLPTIGALLVIAAGNQAWLNRKVLSNRVLVWLGLISFPLYLWHWPLLSLARIVAGETPPLALRIALVLLAILLAWLSYVLVEIRIRSGSRVRAKSLVLIALMVLTGYVGYNSYSRDGLSFRNKTVEAQLAQFAWASSLNGTRACRDKYPGDQYCSISDITAPPTAAIIGDSHANHFFWGLSEYYKRRGGNLINLGAGGCPPFFDIDRGPHPVFARLHCYKRTKPMYDYVLHDEHIRTVYLAFHHSEYFRNDVRFIDELHEINGKDNYSNSLQALLRTIRTLESYGKEVVLIYDMPDLSRDVKDCLPLRPLSFSGTRCTPDLSLLTMIDFGPYQNMVSEAAKKTSIRIFDTHRYLAGNFPIDAKGIATYRDSTHLSMNGSLFFSDKYAF